MQSEPSDIPEVTAAGPAEVKAVARLLHEFNEEFGEPSPGAEPLARRLGELLEAGDTEALLVGEGPDGIAVLHFQQTLWSAMPNCYLAELYVVPDRRGRGLGRALMAAVFESARRRGSDHIDLNTSEADTAARALYRACGFTNREGSERGPRMLYYERDL